MNTEFEEIFDSFKSIITDYSFLDLSEDDEKEIMHRRLKNALAKFKCKKRNIIADYDMEEMNRELSAEEINALSYWLLYEWITPKVMNIELMEHRLNTREFQGYSEANHLDKLKDLRDIAKHEANYWTNQINNSAKYVLGSDS